ncbi:DUF3224 domain-containing protein [Gilvimarinus sp. SDUM040013]|uniref:DUF3224 domain-containing protein n=1 Tax=Gilvimarinus gilvus TaxID=3058038 RepID=A0ABU4S267_9GAMM|nr:DUF3224 domain-containing protein [Gilvimarinus sp. SDUM040013]MDO3384953.1 DUF3224 domain-containing protein [Gilvimarinus sp. SDUM040013]MDX6851251.1 DUF3224 domain-containing protein [Gilvimarinus sp. SDUM040013]
MKQYLVMLIAMLAVSTFAQERDVKLNSMSVTGKFEVELVPVKDDETPAGRMLINKHYSGDLFGQGLGQMLSKRTASGSAAYVALEEFTGAIEGRKGAFTLLHKGLMNEASQSLDIQILPGSGSGDFAGITGSMSIEQSDGEHRYTLNFDLPKGESK